MTLTRTILSLAACAGLAACASTGASGLAWQPRADANLRADRSACERVASDLDIRSPKEFADNGYGIAAAMASRLDRQSVKGGTVARMRDAVFQDCMADKGWTPK